MRIQYLMSIQNFLWQGPVMALMLFTGIYVTIKLRGKQFTHFAQSVRLSFGDSLIKKNIKGDLSPFQSLMTALAGSIGTGNIAGIATAVVIGGYGSLFWMWIMAALGMATAYAESFLSIKYREINENKEISGGPMYVLKNGVKSKTLSTMYAIFAGISAIGIGCLAQSNSVVSAIDSYVGGCSRLGLGVILAILTGATVISGVKSIGKAAGYIVPFMAVLYLLGGLFVIVLHWHNLPDALSLILTSAFTGKAAVGGVAGASMLMAMQNGIQYGIFANEAGLGSLSIAAASAKTDSPAEQGLRSSFGVFFATMIVCTITGLLLAVSVQGLPLKGSALAVAAFSTVHPHFSIVVVIGLTLFAFTTMLAWCYYGEKSLEFLFGTKVIIPYRWAFIAMVVAGACMDLDVVWTLANLSSACMAFPNLIGILLLRRELY